MNEMSSHERIKRMYEHREADRVPILDTPWGATIERWHAEGMPKDVNYVECFGLDRVASISADNSPRYEARTIEDADEYRIYTTSWGATLKNWKRMASTPEFLDFTIVDRDSWEKAKARMSPTRDRINWKHLEENYPKWRQSGLGIIRTG